MPDCRFARPIRKSSADRRTYRGVVVDSIAEMGRAAELDRLLRSGHIVAWFRQIPVMLGDDFTTRIDFLVIGPDRVWFEEVKGFDNRRWREIVRLWRKRGPLPLSVLWALKGGWRVENIPPGPSVVGDDRSTLLNGG